MIDKLFFELIQVAIGARATMSRTPTGKEWGNLYKMAAKQSLLGICFAGVQRLGANADDGFAKIGMPEMLYLTWMGTAAQIQRRNEVMNQRCVELTKMFRNDGFDVVILKGQSVARRYGTLSPLRQSGDIDAWLTGSRDVIMKYITQQYKVGEVIYNHAHVNIFNDTEVEVHFTPSWLYSFRRNKSLQKWFASYRNNMRFYFDEHDSFKSPSTEFDIIYLMLHSYRHLMHEGLGLRQVMDCYWTIVNNSSEDNKSMKTTGILADLGLRKFAGAMMYVMKVVFGLDEKPMLCEIDERRGKRLLEEIMLGGNMGRGDKRTGKSTTHIGYFLDHVGRQWSFMKDYPSEVFWSPIWKAWHFVMRKTGKI